MIGRSKCSECGFLALVNQTTIQYECAPQLYRDTCLPVIDGSGRPLFQELPVCAERVPEFDCADPNLNTRHRLVALRKRRTCDKFLTWQPSLQLKDHKEMKLLAEVDRRTLAWRAEDLQWQENQEKLATKRHDDSTKATAFTQKLAVCSLIIAAVVAAWNIFGPAKQQSPVPGTGPPTEKEVQAAPKGIEL